VPNVRDDDPSLLSVLLENVAGGSSIFFLLWAHTGDAAATATHKAIVDGLNTAASPAVNSIRKNAYTRRRAFLRRGQT
jgi:hypothetical protein